MLILFPRLRCSGVPPRQVSQLSFTVCVCVFVGVCVSLSLHRYLSVCVCVCVIVFLSECVSVFASAGLQLW